MNAVNNKKVISSILIYFILSSVFLCFLMNSMNKEKNNALYQENTTQNQIKREKLPLANDIDNNYISQNASVIRRGFESINFTINAASIQYANKTFMQISFTNNSIINFSMEYIKGSNFNFTYTFSPKGDAPLGTQKVNFLIYNETMNQLNVEPPITYRYFIIRSNSLVTFNATEYIRNQNVRADIVIDNSSVFQWRASVVNSTGAQQKTIYTDTQSPFQINFPINSSFNQLNHFYYVIINMSLKTGGSWKADYFGFYVKNAVPIVNENSIIFNPTSVFRQIETCFVKVNASDNETSFGNIIVNMNVYDPNNNLVRNPQLLHIGNGIFEGNFTVDSSSPKGNYKVQFEATDENGGTGIGTDYIDVKNNSPEINGFEINNIETDERISVRYGEDLTFKFDVDDIEGISYVTVNLKAEDAIEGQKDEYEISAKYEDDLEIIIRTEDLVTGTWTVYISVTDIDGETTDLDDNFDTGPQQIIIIPDILSNILPWITLIIGAIIGLIVGIGIAYFRAKEKYLKYKDTEEKIPSKKESVSAKKQVKGEKPSIKPEVVKKKPEEKLEKKEPERIIDKRKIKRKL